MEKSKTPLDAVLLVVLDYANTWGPEGFPVPPEEEADLSAASDGGAEGGSRMPPKLRPLLLHRAVWAQAEVLATRCRLLSRVGETLSSAVQGKADLVRRENPLQL